MQKTRLIFAVIVLAYNLTRVINIIGPGRLSTAIAT
jgi:hypothetical protein